MEWITAHWIEIVAALWALEKLLETVSTITPWKWDDNIGIILGKILRTFFPKPK
jgi:hypothetical protein